MQIFFSKLFLVPKSMRIVREADNPEFFVLAFTGGVSVMNWECIGPIGVGNLYFVKSL